MKSINPYAWIEKSLDTLERATWYRSVKTITSLPGPRVELEGDWLINFASNDYLGLAGDQRLIKAAVEATQIFGTGTTGSRLLSGHRQIHQELEKMIASLKKTEASLVFSSGYLANLGTITALVGKRDLILGDIYNHSSLKNGAILSGATVFEYQHCDLIDLRNQLSQHRDNYRKCLILTDGVFSMDGDLCPLPGLLDLATEFNAMLLIDEAHATGVLGETGAGCVEYFQCIGQPLIEIGTLSKALGSLGGYVAGSSLLIEFLRNRAASWIYTTGLTPGDTAAALESLKIIKEEPQHCQKLWENINDLKTLFAEYQIEHKDLPKWGNSPIFCIPCRDAKSALQISQFLRENGIFVPAIRPPTVKTSRLRISLMATHHLDHLQQLVEVLSLSGNFR